MKFPTVAVTFVSPVHCITHKDKLNSVFTLSFERMVVHCVNGHLQVLEITDLHPLLPSNSCSSGILKATHLAVVIVNLLA